MKRLIASLAVVGLMATPALATTTTAKPTTTKAPAKPAKAKHKMKKGVKTTKPAASTDKTSG